MASTAVHSCIAASAIFVTGCAASADSSVDETAQGGGAANVARKVVTAPDGSLRVPYLGGAFVTYNREMPIEVEQAIAGLPTDRPVIVWAGD